MEFPSVWVSGEISNFAQPQSGHCYFSLKDEKAQIRAVLWRGAAGRLPFRLVDGLEIICRGHLEVYAPRGSYQLVVEEATPRGVGALELALRQLREKLAAEGLFHPARKKRLPAFPRRIGVVTSPTGAAIHDFLEVLNRRWRGVHVLILPTRVQGEGSALEIIASIQAAAQIRPPVDVLVVTRGGGSMEDLRTFNEESVVRAVAACPIPTVSAIGHEIDVTLTDLAADIRALTPSEAAERVLPAAMEVQTVLDGHAERLENGMRRRLDSARTRIDSIAAERSFRRPFERIRDLARRLDESSDRAVHAMGVLLRERGSQLKAVAGKLESLSPLAVLGRGYSVTQRTRDGLILRRTEDLVPGEAISTRFASGSATSIVDHIHQDPPTQMDGKHRG